MNVVLNLWLYILTFLLPLQGIFPQRTGLRKAFQYELTHPRLSISATRSLKFRNGLEEPKLPPVFLPPPELPPQPPPLIPDILNHIFQEGPSMLKEVANNLLPPYLFTPNTNNEPAATLGQMENFKKDLEEQAMEEEQNQNNITSDFRKPEVFDERQPRLYVSSAMWVTPWN